MRKVPFFDLVTGSYGQGVHLIERGSVLTGDEDRLHKPEKIYTFAKKYLYQDPPAEEYVYMIGLNNTCMPLGICEISHGTVSASLISPRSILIRALLMKQL